MFRGRHHLIPVAGAERRARVGNRQSRKSIYGERGASMEMPDLVTWKDGRPKESTVGSGQFETRWLRMQWANLRQPGRR